MLLAEIPTVLRAELYAVAALAAASSWQSKFRVVPLLDRRIEGVHVDVDDFADDGMFGLVHRLGRLSVLRVANTKIKYATADRIDSGR